MKTYQQGETAVLDCDVTNRAGTATNPDTSIAITITDPAGTDQVSAAAMTNDGTGDYHYDYNIRSRAALGVWTYDCVATNAGDAVIQHGQFEVKERIIARVLFYGFNNPPADQPPWPEAQQVWWTVGLEGRDTSVSGYVDGEPLTAAHYDWDGVLEPLAESWPEGARVMLDIEGFHLDSYWTADAQIRQWMVEYKLYLDTMKGFRPDCSFSVWHVPIHMPGIYQSAYPAGASCAKWLQRHTWVEMQDLYDSLDYVVPVCYPYHADLNISAVFSALIIEKAREMGTKLVYPFVWNRRRYVFAPRDPDDPYSGCFPTQPDGSPWDTGSWDLITVAEYTTLLEAQRDNADGVLIYGGNTDYALNDYMQAVLDVFAA